MRRIVVAVLASFAVLLSTAHLAAAGCGVGCGGCSDPCVRSQCGGCTTCGECVPCCERLDTGPVELMRVILEPKYDVVKRSICCTEYKEERRVRPVTVRKSVPIEEEKICLETVYVPKTETKVIEYTVSVPIKEEKTREYTTTVPKWTEVEEQYTVNVPELVQVEETYNVKVPTVEEVPCEYTVMVPSPQKRVVMQTVTNAVPVEKTRTIRHCVPVVTTKMVEKDYGHWETRVVQAPCCGSGYTGCGGCGAASRCGPCQPATKTVCKKVWCPNIVKEEVQCVTAKYQTQELKYLAYEQTCEQVPHECVSICYKPEKRAGTKKVVKYVEQPRKRTRTDVQYHEETRTRVKKVLSFEEVTKTETYPVIRYEQQTRTKEVSYTVKVPEQRVKKYTATRFDCVSESKLEECTVCVPVPVVKEVEVQVCRMVPKVVSVTCNPCESCSGGCGCCCGN